MVNLAIEYSDKPVTPFGGMALMKRFLDQVGIREKLGTFLIYHLRVLIGVTAVKRANYRKFLAKHLDRCKSLCALQLAA